MTLGLRKTRHFASERSHDQDRPLGPAVGVSDWTAELITASRSCCCTARPAVAVILPPAASALLLCGHHYRASRDALMSKNARVYDREGHIVTDSPWSFP